MNIENKVVLITGASSGIGAAVAEAFSAEGAKVVMVGRNETKLNAVAARCRDPLIVRADLANEDEVLNIIEKTIEKFGQLDILVNNAGTFEPGSLLGGNILESYEYIMRVNLRAAIYLASLASPHIIKTKGNIVNISSVGGRIPPVEPSVLVYGISKAGLNYFSTAAAVELAPYGVRVNTISPGPVETDFIENTGFPASWDTLKAVTILDRVSEAKEVADLVLLLASDKAKGITGVNYLIDNGMMLKREKKMEHIGVGQGQ